MRCVNRGPCSSADGVHCLTCALMLLNTDLHGHVSVRLWCCLIRAAAPRPCLCFSGTHRFLCSSLPWSIEHSQVDKCNAFSKRRKRSIHRLARSSCVYSVLGSSTRWQTEVLFGILLCHLVARYSSA